MTYGGIARYICAVALALVSLFLAPPAQAANWEKDRVVQVGEWNMGIAACSIMAVGTQQAYGWACFKPDGDLMRVHDNRSDGFMVGMRWYSGTRKGLCYHLGAHGPGSEAEYTVSGTHQCNKNLPEGNRIRFKVGRCKVSRYDCQVLANWQNWGPRRTLRVSQ